MDNLKLKEEIKALQNLGNHLENQLKLVGIELGDLPEDLSAQLDKCVDVQIKGHLHELNLNYLREFYFTKKRESIEYRLNLAQQTAEVKTLMDGIKETETNIAALEKFESTVGKRLITETALKRHIISNESAGKSLLDRQNGLMEEEFLNIENLMDKIDTLEQSN